MRRVPVIDISPFLDGTGKQEVAAAVDRACKEVGFLVIEGHGVPEALLQRASREMLGFFEGPAEPKKECLVTPDNFHGYRGANATALAKSLGNDSPPDLMERFTVGRVDVPDDEYHRTRREKFFRANKWPNRQPAFQETGIAYYRAMESLAATLMRIFAVALGVPENFFERHFDKHISQFVTNYYPAVDQPPPANQFRAGAHTDYGSLTILHPAIASGLQVKVGDAGWEDVPVVPGSFIINLGDLLAQWTNDRWVSTLHRVKAREGSHGERALDLIFFQQPNDDALIECIPTCTSESAPARYSPVSAGDHVAAKLNRAWIGKERAPAMVG